MRLRHPTTAAKLASQIKATLIGDGNLPITGINEIHHVEQGDLTFVDFHKYYDVALSSAASVILIDQVRPCPSGKALLVVDQNCRRSDCWPQRHYWSKLPDQR